MHFPLSGQGLVDALQQPARALGCPQQMHGLLQLIGALVDDGPTKCSGRPVCRYSVEDLRELLPGRETAEERREDHVTPTGAIESFVWIAGRLPS
jgi:hypothetical protein